MTDVLTATCQYCDEPLDHGTGRVINGMHEECIGELNAELDDIEEAAGPIELIEE